MRRVLVTPPHPQQPPPRVDVAASAALRASEFRAFVPRPHAVWVSHEGTFRGRGDVERLSRVTNHSGPRFNPSLTNKAS